MKLPSRFQIGDPVRVGRFSGTVNSVVFTETKVIYYIMTDKGLIGPCQSEDVCEPLRLVS